MQVILRHILADVEDGLIPDDDALLGPMIENICFGNARDFLGLRIPEVGRQNKARDQRYEEVLNSIALSEAALDRIYAS